MNIRTCVAMLKQVQLMKIFYDFSPQITSEFYFDVTSDGQLQMDEWLCYLFDVVYWDAVNGWAGMYFVPVQPTLYQHVLTSDIQLIADETGVTLYYRYFDAVKIVQLILGCYKEDIDGAV